MGPRLRGECCRQSQAEVSTNRRNKIHQAKLYKYLSGIETQHRSGGRREIGFPWMNSPSFIACLPLLSLSILRPKYISCASLFVLGRRRGAVITRSAAQSVQWGRFQLCGVTYGRDKQTAKPPSRFCLNDKRSKGMSKGCDVGLGDPFG